jgi:hypothetical protein
MTAKLGKADRPGKTAFFRPGFQNLIFETASLFRVYP